MSANNCPQFDWCDAAVDDVHEDWHRETGISREEVGVLRTDHSLENGRVILSITDSLEWSVDAEDADAFFSKLRAAIDEAEKRFQAFQAKVRPLQRRTEPGEPEQYGIGGGL